MSTQNNKSHSIMRHVAENPVAANLLMFAIFLVGFWSLTLMNIQFLPTFQVKIIQAEVIWPGANAIDVQQSVTIPLEQKLRGLDFLKELRSTSFNGRSLLVAEFIQSANLDNALDQVKQRISQVRNLPDDAEPAVIIKQENFEPITSILFTTTGPLVEVRQLIRKIERKLLQRGISKVEIIGLPTEEIAIQIPIAQLAKLQVPLNRIATHINSLSKDIPAGEVGRGESGQQLRGISQRRTPQQFATLPILTRNNEKVIHLGDIATIEKRPSDKSVILGSQDKTAVVLNLSRAETENTLKSVKILKTWLEEFRHKISPNIQLKLYDESWQYIQGRINLLLKNGASGLVLIVAILFLFLDFKTALWVAAGVPTAFLAALAAFYFLGGSINVVSLFAFIMTLGIVVDDNIVVGEEIARRVQLGESPLSATVTGTKIMLPPIITSSLTTMFAFIPLLLIGGTLGSIMKTIPIVVICMIFASFIECFFILPGHLYHSYKKKSQIQSPHWQKRFNEKFYAFRDNIFRPAVTFAIENAWVTVSAGITIFILSIGLIIGGRIHFTFFPTPEPGMLYANAQFVSGAPENAMREFLLHVEAAAHEAEQALSPNEKIIHTTIRFENEQPFLKKRGLIYGTVLTELTYPDKRDITNQQFIDAWRERITIPPSVETLSIVVPKAGPPGDDIDIRLSGWDPGKLKAAAEEIREHLQKFSGVSNIVDNMPRGQTQIVYDLNNLGRQLNLDIAEIGAQLRAAFSGALAQIYHQDKDEVEVRVVLPNEERYRQSALQHLPIFTQSGEIIPLGNVVNMKKQPGFDILRRSDGRLAVNITAEVNAAATNTNEILSDLQQSFMPQLSRKYDVDYDYQGTSADQAETLKDMLLGLVLAVCLIYLALVGIFSSYTWAIPIMLTIPLGLTGAILGHVLMGLDLTMLSLFGFFGLSGIVINDGIILLDCYRRLRKTEKLSTHDAIIEATCLRMRPVLLTSITTIAGLAPLLTETSLQAQFLIPMAASISFGLAYATVLVLGVIPAMIAIYERAAGHNDDHQNLGGTAL